ncbi:MAG: TfoX/Sxy family protein [Candidatus Marinimicrobia bacterium]|nr:TfoX/Sxy family protein [Candidatus Neomarinimicrobiota bacterium]
MAQPYLDELTALIEASSLASADAASLDCRHFFSGAAAYVQGQVFALLTPVGLSLKLSPAHRQALKGNHGAKPLRQFPKGPIKRDYVVLSPAMRRDPAALRPWLQASVDYVRSRLPPAAAAGSA